MSKTYVIDCNVIVKWFFDEEDSDKVEFLYKEAKSGEIKLYAPEIIELEFLGVLTKLFTAKKTEKPFSRRSFLYFLEACEDKVINLISLVSKRKEIFEVALDKKIKYFDAEYLYLAKMLNAQLLTFDEDLKKKQSKI